MRNCIFLLKKLYILWICCYWILLHCVIHIIYKIIIFILDEFLEGSERVKLGLAGFCPGKMGFKPLGMEKNVKNKKMGIGFENCKVGFGKKKWTGKWDWYLPSGPYF